MIYVVNGVKQNVQIDQKNYLMIRKRLKIKHTSYMGIRLSDQNDLMWKGLFQYTQSRNKARLRSTVILETVLN